MYYVLYSASNALIFVLLASTQLKKHMMVHTGEKPYSCWICGQSFRRKETRDTHVRYHTRERSFGCKVCDKKYISKSHLRVSSSLVLRKFGKFFCLFLYPGPHENQSYERTRRKIRLLHDL